MNKYKHETWEDRFEKEFEPAYNGSMGKDLIMQNIIREHNKDIKKFIKTELENMKMEYDTYCVRCNHKYKTT